MEFITPSLQCSITPPVSLKPPAQARKPVVRPRNHLDTDDRADLSGRGRAGVCGSFYAGNVAAEKRGDVAAAYFFPASKGDIGRFEGGVGGLEQGTEAFWFNHANCLLRHTRVDS